MRVSPIPSTLTLALCLTSLGCGTYGLEGAPLPTADTGALSEAEAEPETGSSDDAGDDAESDEGGAGDERPDTDDDPDAETDTDSQPDEPACTREGFDILIHQATQDDSVPSHPLFMYQARDTDITPFAELQLISYQAAPYHGPSSPGRYPLSGLNYADCGLCMLLVTNCSDGYSCDEVFFIEDGTLDVVDFGQGSGRFQATIRDAVFAEVEIDPSTYESRPIPGGERWCIQDIGIDVATYWLR